MASAPSGGHEMGEGIEIAPQLANLSLSAEQAQDDADCEVVTDVYFKLSTIQWDWANQLNPWQAAAVKALTFPANLVHPFHPLYQEDGFTVFIGTERNGERRLLLSLKQMEFLQLYIHDMRLADPIWLEHLQQFNAGGEDRVPHDQVGPPEYPGGAEWVPLPNEFCRREEFTTMDTISFDDVRVLRRVQERLRRNNKSIQRQNLVADPSTATTTWDKAVIDNSTDGPGLRKGGQHRLNIKSDDASRRRLEEDEKLISGQEEQAAKTGWGGFPLASRDAEAVGPVGHEAPLATPQTVVPPSNVSSISKDDQLGSISPRDIIGDRAAPALPDEHAEYYHLAQQALTVAALGGAFAAHQSQNGYHDDANDDDPSEDASTLPPIGKGLFISIHIGTWEADESVVLEIGWSAIWWQVVAEDGAATEKSRQFEEMRDRGHYIVQDHLLTKKNVMWRSDMRQEYLFGDSLPVTEVELDSTLTTLIKDLSKKAGGGPTYVVIHGAFELDRLDMGTENWYNSLKPLGWEYPAFSCTDGIKNTFIINTAVLFAAIENRKDPNLTPSHIPLEELGSMLFGRDGALKPEKCSNAGNDAFYNLEILLSILTGPPLEELRKDFVKSQELAAAEMSADPTSVADGGAQPAESTGVGDAANGWPENHSVEDGSPPSSPLMSSSPDTEPLSDSDSDVEHIKGVYWDQGAGDLVEI